MEGFEMIATVDQASTKAAALARRRAVLPENVLMEFRAELLDEVWCRMFILKRLHGEDPRCPECSGTIQEKSLQRFWLGERVRCEVCGKFFTALTGTFLSGSHLSFQEIILLMFLLQIHVPDKQVAEVIEVSVEAVRIWRHKFQAIERLQAMDLVDRNDERKAVAYPDGQSSTCLETGAHL